MTNGPAGYVIANVSVVDAEHGVVRPPQTVTIAGARIAAMSGEGAAVPAPASFGVIDGSGLYLMPGLIDSHVHYFDPVGFGPVTLAHGVVMVRDMGNTTEQALQIRAAIRSGTVLGPDIVTTGAILDGDPPHIPLISLVCGTAEQGREHVRRQAAAGVDQIKVYSGLERDVYLAIVAESLRLGLKPVGHVPEVLAIGEAASAGQASVEHLFGFEKMLASLLGDTLQLKRGGMGSRDDYWLRLREVDPGRLHSALRVIRQSGLAVCPTIVVFSKVSQMRDFMHGRHPMAELVSPMVRGIWDLLWKPSDAEGDLVQAIWPQMQAFVLDLHRAGVPLLIGTDLAYPGVIPGYSVHEEMVLWQAAGVPPADILRSATTVPAGFLGLADHLGSIKPGHLASLALVRGNPLADIRNAGSIEQVFLRGSPYSPAELLERYRSARAAAAGTAGVVDGGH